LYTEFWPENKILKSLVVFINFLRLLNPLLSYDMVYCTPGIVSSSLPTILARKFRRFNLIADWDDSFFDFEAFKPSFYESCYWEHLCVKMADIVLVVSKKLSDTAAKLGKEHIVYIPNGVDTKLFDPAKYRAERQNVRLRFGISVDDIVAGFVGSMPIRPGGNVVGSELFPIMDINPSVKLMIVGIGTGFEFLKHNLNKSSYKNQLILVDYVEHSILPTILSAMDIGVVPLDVNSYTSFTRSSFKMKDFMAMDMPIVCVGVGENRVDLEEGKYGILVQNSDKLPEGVRKVIETGLCFNPREKAKDYEFDKLASRLDKALEA
jgi:glycosyltransferase involved in cell wall biosynthesis